MSDSNSIFQKPASKLEAMSKDLGFDVPVEFVTLPSRGVIYTPEHPLCNAEGVEVKCMTAKEEDLLSSRALMRNGTLMTKLMQSCLLNKSVDPDQLIMGDRNAILIALRITGYGPDYDVEIRCPECVETFKNTFTLNGLTIKRLAVAPETPNTNVFNFTLPLTKLPVKFKLLTGKDEAEVSAEIEAKKKIGSQVDTVVTSRLFHAILSINGETDRQKLSRMVANLRAGDAKALRTYMDKIEPNVDMKQKATCPHCNASSEVDIPLGMSFFWPDFGK